MTSHEERHVVDVRDHGAEPDSGKDAGAAVRRALEACRTGRSATLVFPRGRYDFWAARSTRLELNESNTYDRPTRSCAVVVDGFEDLVVDGGGSTFVMHGPVQPVTVLSSRRVVLRDLTIDWDRPLTAQARVIDAAAHQVTLAVADESPYEVVAGQLLFVGEDGERALVSSLMEFDAEGARVTAGTGDPGSLRPGWRQDFAVDLAPGTVQLRGDFSRRPAVGNVVVLRHTAREHAGVFIGDSHDVRVDHLRLHHTGGLGMLAQTSGDLTFTDVAIVPNRDRGRVFSSHDDGIHLSGCRGQVTVERCRFEGLMDDDINVHGTYVQIVEVTSPTQLTCRFVNDMSQGLRLAEQGDQVQILDPRSMAARGCCRVEDVEPLSRSDVVVHLTDPVPPGTQPGDAMENLTWTPHLTVRDCYFGGGRARGLLLSTPGTVLVEGNEFQSSGSAVLVAGDANYWFESGAVRDVTIRGNLFGEHCLTSAYQFCDAIISVCPEVPKPDPVRPFHHGITIVDNEFHPFDAPVLRGFSTGNLRFVDNVLHRSHAHEPWHPGSAMITLDHCRDVEVSGNRLVGDVLGRDVALVGTPDDQVVVAPDQGVSVRTRTASIAQ